MNKVAKNFLTFFVIFVAIAVILSFFSGDRNQDKIISINELAQQINSNEVRSISVEGPMISVTLNNDAKEIVYKEENESFGELIKNYGINPDSIKNLSIEVVKPKKPSIITSILPFLIPVVMVLLIIWFMMRQVQGANNRAMTFGQSGVKEADIVDVSFKNVAGAEEAKEELMEVVDFLKNPKKYLELGAKIPKGVLLLGAPGVGKTLLARAVAGEAKVPFYYISGSEFVEMFVGVGASRVRDLFKKAKKNSPCIVFIDEIDAVGRQRGAGIGGSHDEREQTLNQILVEMDGFETNTTVIVLAATNRADILDPALLRPGRFDRRVMIDMPDIKDREAILAVHAKKIPLAKDADLLSVAQRTPGFSGAELANVINEAAIFAARSNKKEIKQEMLYSAIEKVLLGPEKKNKIRDAEDLKMTAFHEAGHAVVGHFCEHSDPIHKISIVSRGRAGGYTILLPETDKPYKRKSEFLDQLASMLGGYIAELKNFGEVSTGPHNDLEQVTKIARAMVTKFGMSEELGTRIYGETDEMIFLGREIHESRNYSEETARKIDEEVQKYITIAYKKAEKILEEKKDKVKKLVDILLEKETVEKEEFVALMNS